MYQFAPSRKENEKRFQRRHLLRLLSFAFRVESCLEPEPTRHSGTDNHPDKDPSSFRGGGCWAWLRRRNGNGRSRESEDCSSGLTIPQRWGTGTNSTWGSAVLSQRPVRAPARPGRKSFRIVATSGTSRSLGCYAAQGYFWISPGLGANPSRVGQWQDCRTRLSLSIIAQRPTNFCSSSG